MIKVALVSGILPAGHYTENLAVGIEKTKKVDLSIYTDKDPKNLQVKGCGTIKLVWSKTPFFLLEILKQISKDQPDIVHFQHEINMFGGLSTALLFPVLLFFSRLSGAKVVTTVHATVDQKQINSEFVSTFNKNPALINPLILKLFFKYLYNGIYFFSDITFVHTKTAKRVLGKYHRGWNKKIVIIPTAIPLVPQKTFKKKNYFFYFGYIARRKGLENLVSGFKSFLTKNPRTNFKLILAGGVIKGQESSLKELMGIMRSANLKNHIKYVGFLNRREQYKLYSESYAVVIPAKLSISASGPLYHALSHGKFILASNIGHLKDEIKHGVNGYLTDNDSWDQAFKTVTSRASLMRKIEEGAREEAGLRTPLRTAQKYYQYYQSLLS